MQRPQEARTVLSFNDRVNLSWNGDLIHVVHLPNGHSDGDVMAHSRENTLFIPGHGPMADLQELESHVSMLRTIAQRIRTMVEEGMSREDVVAARPAAEFDAAWGSTQGFGLPAQ